jgi:hypothetical protein
MKSASMFTIRLRRFTFDGWCVVTATTATLRNALGFVGEFADPNASIDVSWSLRGGCYLGEVFDWYDCWFPDPKPLAEIIAPIGFAAPTEQMFANSRVQY